MLTEAKFIKTLLPAHYLCEPKHNGVFCYSTDHKYIMPPNVWFTFNDMLKVKFGNRLVEIINNENRHQHYIKNHLEFTVVLRK